MKYERSVITMTLHWYSFQIFSLSNYVDNTLTETGLNAKESHDNLLVTLKKESLSDPSFVFTFRFWCGVIEICARLYADWCSEFF